MVTHGRLDVVRDREILEKTNVLKGSCDTHPAPLIGFFTQEALILKINISPVWCINTCQQVEYGGFTRPVRSDQARDLSFFNIEGRSLEGMDTSEVDGEIFYVQYHRSHDLPPFCLFLTSRSASGVSRISDRPSRPLGLKSMTTTNRLL